MTELVHTMTTCTGRMDRRMTPMLDLDVIARGPLRTQPFDWAVLEGVIAHDRALCAAFPTAGFQHHERATGSKPYRLACRTLLAVDGTLGPTSDLHPDFTALVAQLQQPAYRQAIASLTGLDLAGAPLGITLWRYDPNAFLGPHQDEPHKLVSHVIYLTEAWEPSWGGCLQLLDEGGRVYTDLVPRAGLSVVLVRSEASWHSVAPVQPGDGPRVRQTLQVVFHAPGFRFDDGRAS